MTLVPGASIEFAVLVLIAFGCGIAWGLYRGAALWREPVDSEVAADG